MAVDLEKIKDSPHLLDLLLQMEDVLDSLDIYVFKNWFKGEIVEGPVIRRYWLDFTLKYNYNQMPDPRAGLRLLKYGIRVEYERSKAQKTKEDYDEEDENSPGSSDSKPVWLVTVSMPRRLVSQVATSELDFYDDDIDIDDVEDAKDSGADDEAEGYENPDAEQAGNGDTGGEGAPGQQAGEAPNG